ncbi:MAG: glycosyltransferase family 9 protein [Veillonellales bacterium]
MEHLKYSLKNVKKIAVFQRASLGDTLLATPTLRAIKETCPNSRTVILAKPAAKDILDGHPLVDDLLLYKKGDSVFPIIKKIWRADLALVLDSHYRSSFFAWLARIPVRVGRSPVNKSFLTHQVTGTPNCDTYEVENTLAVARFAGIDTKNYQLEMAPVRSHEKEKVHQLLQRTGVKDSDKNFVILAPYSLSDIKDWPSSNYQKVIEFLRIHGYIPIIVSGRENRERADELKGAINFAGRMNLRETTYLISLSQLVICGCTSVLHLAATTHTPQIALYGPTTPVQWAPRTRCIVISKFLDCSPCYGTVAVCPKGKMCIESIEVDEVLSAICKVLNITKH